MRIFGERTGEEYEVSQSVLPVGMFGVSEFEILRDKHHITTVYPGSLNDRAKFPPRLFYRKESLDKLDVGFAPDGTGTQVVGAHENFVNRRFVDAFVECMSEVYNVSWENVRVWIRGPVRAEPLPVFLVSEMLGMAIAPYRFVGQHLEPKGKYQPVSMGHLENRSSL